jgi:hypothetical protein
LGGEFGGDLAAGEFLDSFAEFEEVGGGRRFEAFGVFGGGMSMLEEREGMEGFEVECWARG